MWENAETTGSPFQHSQPSASSELPDPLSYRRPDETILRLPNYTTGRRRWALARLAESSRNTMRPRRGLCGVGAAVGTAITATGSKKAGPFNLGL